MPTWTWILLWAVAIAVVAALYLRERRNGRPPVGEIDRFKHDAAREAEVRSQVNGPNVRGNSTFG